MGPSAGSSYYYLSAPDPLSVYSVLGCRVQGTLQTSLLPRQWPLLLGSANRRQQTEAGWLEEARGLVNRGRQGTVFRVKEQHGKEQKERMKHIVLAGQWLGLMCPWLVSLGCGARGAVRSVDGKEGRARA